MNVAWLAELLKPVPQDLVPYITNGDLPSAPIASVSVQAADFGEFVLISWAGTAVTIATAADLAGQLRALPQDLEVYLTNGDLPPVPAAAVIVQPADYGQLVLISR